MSHCYAYARPALTVDNVVLSADDPPHVLLIHRKNEPWAGCWALPGGFVDDQESLIGAAARELREETNLDVKAAGLELMQIGTWGEPGRDPRGWVVDVVYACMVPEKAAVAVAAGDDAAAARWWPVDAIPLPLACEHHEMILLACKVMAEGAVAAADPRLRRQLLEAAAAHVESRVLK